MSEKPETVNFDTAPPLQVVQYDNLISKFVPGYSAIFQIALAHLQTVLPDEAHILVVGAGSGKELLTFAEAMPNWSLTGVDPSAHMLALARQKIADSNLAQQIRLHQGFVTDLDETNLFDAATSILVMHFLPDDGTKLNFLSSIAARIKPGAPLILLDIYGGPEFVKDFGPTWIQHGHLMGLPLEMLQKLEQGHANFHPITETRTLELLEQTGFGNVRRFYVALVYGGWIATKI